MLIVTGTCLEEIKAQGEFTVPEGYEFTCTGCGGSEFRKGGHTKRHVYYNHIFGDHGIITVPVLQCKSCKARHTVLPDILLPYKRYLAFTFEGIYKGEDMGDYCDPYTMQKIYQGFIDYMDRVKSAIMMLNAHIKDAGGIAVNPLEELMLEDGWLSWLVRAWISLNQNLHDTFPKLQGSGHRKDIQADPRPPNSFPA
jgi:hypothetical protein